VKEAKTSKIVIASVCRLITYHQ